MEHLQLGAVERRFAELVWRNAPLPSGKLVKLCAEELGWKKSTTYTVLKKLCDRGLFSNEDGTVTALVSREAYEGAKSLRFVEESFQGSLPAFVAAFSAARPLSAEEVVALRRMIDEWEAGK